MIFRFLTLITFFILISFKFSYADNHDTETNIIDKAKEINQKVKEKQALQNSASNQEEPLPLKIPSPSPAIVYMLLDFFPVVSLHKSFICFSSN